MPMVKMAFNLPTELQDALALFAEEHKVTMSVALRKILHERLMDSPYNEVSNKEAVTALLIEGKTNRQIVEQLGLDDNTVAIYRYTARKENPLIMSNAEAVRDQW